MKIKSFFGFLSIILLTSILFTQQGTDGWKGLAFFGFLSLGIWKFSK